MAKQQGLNARQLNSLKYFSPQRRGGMVRHARARVRTVSHNNAMIREMKKGKSVPEAHEVAVENVGL